MNSEARRHDPLFTILVSLILVPILVFSILVPIFVPILVYSLRTLSDDPKKTRVIRH